MGEYGEIRIFGWGLRYQTTQMSDAINFLDLESEITPVYQTVLAFIYLGASMVLIISSSFIKKGVNFLIPLLLGISHLLYAIVAMFLVIAPRSSDYGMPLQGTNNWMIGEFERIVASSIIQPGFYLALVTGCLLLMLSVLRFYSVRKT